MTTPMTKHMHTRRIYVSSKCLHITDYSGENSLQLRPELGIDKVSSPIANFQCDVFKFHEQNDIIIHDGGEDSFGAFRAQKCPLLQHSRCSCKVSLYLVLS